MTTIFLDNCLSPRYAKMLQALGEDVKHLQEVFEPDTIDEKWIPDVAARGWPIITGDNRILSRIHERRAMVTAGALAVFLPKRFSALDLWSQVQWITKAWPNIREALKRPKPGCYVSVQENGKAEFIPCGR